MTSKQWSFLTDDAKDLITQMLEVDPSRRVTVENALKHPWIHVSYQSHSPVHSVLWCYWLDDSNKTQMWVVALFGAKVGARDDFFWHSKSQSSEQYVDWFIFWQDTTSYCLSVVTLGEVETHIKSISR